MTESKPSIVTVSVDKFAYPQNEEGNEVSRDQRFEKFNTSMSGETLFYKMIAISFTF